VVDKTDAARLPSVGVAAMGVALSTSVSAAAESISSWSSARKGCSDSPGHASLWRGFFCSRPMIKSLKTGSDPVGQLTEFFTIWFTSLKRLLV
jgi:hypothetical protein